MGMAGILVMRLKPVAQFLLANPKESSYEILAQLA